MEFIGSELQRQVLKRNAKDVLLELDTKQEYDRDFGMQLKEHLEFVYPYMADVSLHSKMSVSEVKKMGQPADDESEVPFESVKKGIGRICGFRDRSCPRQCVSPCAGTSSL